MLFKIGFIDIDMTVLISFLIGIVFGFVLMALWYLVAVISSLNKGLRKRKTDVIDIDEEEIKWLIKDAHKLFKDKDVRNEIGYGKYLFQLSKDLSNDIASKFYPKSKYPYLELTLDESLVLLKYVSDRLDELLEKRILKMFKGMTLRRLMTLNDTKTKFEDNIIVKSSNKLQVGQVFKKGLMVLNAVNPVYWFRKLVVDNVINIVLIRLGLVVISLVGEETYKIYSKKVFDVELELDSDIDSIFDEIKKAIKEEDLDDEKKK